MFKKFSNNNNSIAGRGLVGVRNKGNEGSTNRHSYLCLLTPFGINQHKFESLPFQRRWNRGAGVAVAPPPKRKFGGGGAENIASAA